MNNTGRYYVLAQCGMEMVVPTIAGIFVDQWLGTSPVFVLIFTVFGLVGGITHMVMLSKQIEEADKIKKSNDHGEKEI